jgi:DNA repair protein RadC
MAISDWPAPERPREKLLVHGARSLSDAELLAIFLRVGTRGKTAVDLARDLLKKFGGLRKLFEIGLKDFCQNQGLGVAKYTQLQAILEISQRYLQAELQNKDVLNNTDATRAFLTARLGSYTHEVFACLYLNNNNQILAFEELFQGTINNAYIHPRILIKRALEHNATALIFAHNHPSGNINPSSADKELTQHLIQVLQMIDIRVLDHFIIGRNESASFVELGLL